MRKVQSIQDVVNWRLCVGCGICASLCKKDDAVELINLSAIGIRPKFNPEICHDCNYCLQFCPGYHLDAKEITSEHSNQVFQEHLLLGEFVDIWEGYASSQRIRKNASSGGILTAISNYCIEEEGMGFILHTGMDSKKPWQNKTVISRTVEEISRRTGSRYNTSSPCEWIHRIETSRKPCVFIGKPCDVAAVQMARKCRPELDRKLGLVLSFFCAGAPCSEATINLSEAHGIKQSKIKSLHYRGQGWPGHFRVNSTDSQKEIKIPYIESWVELSRKRPFRCHLCPDGVGQLADITSGDAWNKYNSSNNNLGLSHIITRSKRGQDIIQKAIETNYLKLSPSAPVEIIQGQGLLDRRKILFGRLLAMKTMGIPITNFSNFQLSKIWFKNSILQMLKSILSTHKRILQRGLWHKNTLF